MIQEDDRSVWVVVEVVVNDLWALKPPVLVQDPAPMFTLGPLRPIWHHGHGQVRTRAVSRILVLVFCYWYKNDWNRMSLSQSGTDRTQPHRVPSSEG